MRFPILILPLVFVLCEGLEPFTTGALVGAGIAGSAAVLGAFSKIKCSFSECCETPYIKYNVTEFETRFDQNVFGQHLVRDIVSKALRSHLRKIGKSVSNIESGPRKALVLSFHGWTGGGKNYVAQFIAESLFKYGLKSSYVHLFVSTYHFPDEKKTDIYKLNLQDWIRGNVTLCPQSLFIFDEIDKMGDGLIDAIKPFIDYHQNINGVDFRKSIFIFLSNTGGKQLTQKTLEAWREGRKRENITYQELEELIQLGAFNEIGGLHQSAVIQKSLIDHYVPFLPLEREHVRLCAIVEAFKRNKTLESEQIYQLANDLSYWPQEESLYSTTGCKRVGQKIDIILEDLEEDDL